MRIKTCLFIYGRVETVLKNLLFYENIFFLELYLKKIIISFFFKLKKMTLINHVWFLLEN